MKSKLLNLTLALSLVTILSCTVNAYASDTPHYNMDTEKQLVEEKMEQYFKNPKPLEIDTKENENMILARSSGDYPTRNGVILVTTDKKDSGLPNGTGHAGIIYSGFGTIESFPSGGVQRRVNDWSSRYDNVRGLSVRGTSSGQDGASSAWCNNQVGKSYNWAFTDTSTRNRFYCSHLVWSAFMDNCGVNLDDDGGIIYPIDLVISRNTSVVYAK